MSTSTAVFLALLVVELPLAWIATRRASTGESTRLSSLALWAVIGIPIGFALGTRAHQALLTPGILEWDETYYLSQAVTAAAGRGLYPYIYGYDPMPILGGQGYAAYVQALAVLIAGPSLVALRFVSLLGAVAALVAFWLLLRRLYGSAAAWIGVALLANLRLFLMANTIRMDSWTLAAVTAALVLVARAFAPGASTRTHFLAGLAFGAGLQVHLDSVVTFGACGLLYLAQWISGVRVRGVFFPRALVVYVGGWLVGLAAFLLFNVLPDPDAFYRTTVLVRVDATSWYSSGTSSVAGSFLNPGVILAKESARYGLLARALHPLEVGLFAAAIVALALRRQAQDVALAIVITGIFLLSAVILNNASPLYFIHVMPALAVPLAALFSHGIRRTGSVSLDALPATRLCAFVLVIAALCAVTSAKIVERHDLPAADDEVAALVASARQVVPASCRVAGDGDLYVRYFADYPFFISARPTEVSYAMLFHGSASEADYWEMKKPGAVIAPSGLSDGLRTYVDRHDLRNVEPGVWLSPTGCTPGP